MSRTVELTGDELNKLISQKHLDLGLASRTIGITQKHYDSSQKEVFMNYEGDGYKPVKVTIEFEYDENMSFSEGDD